MEFGFVDCHCHISAREFEQDLDDVIARSREVGIKTLIAVTEGVEEFNRVLQLHKSTMFNPKREAGLNVAPEVQVFDEPLQGVLIYPDLVAPCFGVHPLQPERRSVKPQDLEAALPEFYNHKEQLVAVGEIGLDFTPWCVSAPRDRDDQMRVFVKQLNVAKELELPVNVHTRSAAAVAIQTMKEQGVSRALLHNFAGKPSVALEGVKAGYYFSFPPAVCHNRQRDKLIKQIPLEHICLETDSPALGPHKHERNEPRSITLICSHIASVKGLPAQSVQTVTTQNAHKLFPRASRH